MRWAVVLLFLTLCFACVSSYYRCNEHKQCHGTDQCCNVRSYFNRCCPRASTCCANGPRAKCCGPMDSCCNSHRHRGVSCCPSTYRCCGAGRYGGIRNTCCYKVPVWLWILMGISLSLILLMLLLSLVECMLEEQASSGTGTRDYRDAYYSHPQGYGTYTTYNNNDLYNEPYTRTPPPTYTTPPPNYEQSVNNTPPSNRATPTSSGQVQRRGATQQGSGNSTGERGDETIQSGTDSLNVSDLSGMAGDIDTTRSEADETDLETSVSLNTSNTDSRDVLEQSRDKSGQSRDTREEESGESREKAGPVSPLGNMWERYLRRTLGRREKSEEGERSAAAEEQLSGSYSQRTLDSGIATEGVISCSDSDSDSSFHCSSWEDEEEIRQGNSIVYELSGKRGITRVPPRLQNLVQKSKLSDTQTDEHTDTQTHRPASEQTDNK